MNSCPPQSIFHRIRDFGKVTKGLRQEDNVSHAAFSMPGREFWVVQTGFSVIRSRIFQEDRVGAPCVCLEPTSPMESGFLAPRSYVAAAVAKGRAQQRILDARRALVRSLRAVAQPTYLARHERSSAAKRQSFDRAMRRARNSKRHLLPLAHIPAQKRNFLLCVDHPKCSH